MPAASKSASNLSCVAATRSGARKLALRRASPLHKRSRFDVGPIILLTAALLFVAGCRTRPKAPALIDEPVYQSAEGFRFLVPEGWIMAARANVPSGPVEKERLLVQYRRANSAKQATLEVSLADLPEETDLATYLSGPSFSANHWTQSEQPQTLEVGGVNGTRFRFLAPIRGAEMVREVTAFRRGGRVYFFTVLFSPKDATAPEQARRAIDSLVWTK